MVWYLKMTSGQGDSCKLPAYYKLQTANVGPPHVLTRFPM